MRFHEAIEQSCDTFFYTTAQKIGTDKIVEMAHRFGLGEIEDIGLTGEKAGNIPTPEWKMKRFKQRWSGGDTINYGIGQGYVLATPLQLVTMVARMASGNKVMPRLYVPEGEEKPEFTSLGMSSELMRVNIEAMAAVANSQHGTAYGKRITDPRFAMGGKTGTSQVRKILQRGQNQDLLPWEFRHHALFVGFAPIDNPKYACCVAIEHGGGGGSAAAPVARDVLLRIQQMDAGIDPATQKIPPPPRQTIEQPETTEENMPDNNDVPEDTPEQEPHEN